MSKEQLPEGADAGLRVGGVVVFSDRSEDIAADMAAELAYDEARDAVVEAARVVMGVPVPNWPEYDALYAALQRYDAAKAAYPWQTP